MGYISTFPVGIIISSPLYITKILISRPENIPGNILNGVLIIGQSNYDEIIAFDAINGTKRWSNENFMFRNLSSINLLNGKLYFGDLDGYLHEVDAGTGEILGITRTSLGAINQVVLNDEFIAASDFSGKIKIFEIF